MRPVGVRLHPTTTWICALAILVSASASQSLWFVAFLSVGCIAAMFFIERRANFESKPGRGALLYLWLASIAVFARLLFGLVFGGTPLSGSNPSNGWQFSLPDLWLNLGFGAPVHILGTITDAQLENFTLLGTRVAAMIAIVGLANLTADPRALLKSAPAAFYEVSLAMAMAIKFGPQLVASAEQIRRARQLRSSNHRRVSSGTLVAAVLQDSIEKSLRLAESMDARGFGSTAGSLVPPKALTLLPLLTITGLGCGCWFVLAGNPVASWLAFGVTALAAGALLKLKPKSGRTRYRKVKRTTRDWVALVLAFAAAGSGLMGWWPR